MLNFSGFILIILFLILVALVNIFQTSAVVKWQILSPTIVHWESAMYLPLSQDMCKGKKFSSQFLGPISKWLICQTSQTYMKQSNVQTAIWLITKAALTGDTKGGQRWEWLAFIENITWEILTWALKSNWICINLEIGRSFLAKTTRASWRGVDDLASFCICRK